MQNQTYFDPCDSEFVPTKLLKTAVLYHLISTGLPIHVKWDASSKLYVAHKDAGTGQLSCDF